MQTCQMRPEPDFRSVRLLLNYTEVAVTIVQRRLSMGAELHVVFNY